ncbi:unnamed protein product [Durusdinium trenchii]|uniref:SET domain-containing protein n=1 Tax=Durusdinium trenchii TaxID=1381693 RepID=A0ABP0HLH9_9DINO
MSYIWLRKEMKSSLVANHVATYHGEAVAVAQIAGKGRVLLANVDFEPGERILLEYPLIEVVADDSIPAFQVLQRLEQDGQLEFSLIFYWAALSSLTQPEDKSSRIGRMVAAALVPPWRAVPKETQVQALELHTPELTGPSPSVLKILEALWGYAAEAPAALLVEQLLQVWIYNSFDLSEDGKEAGVIFLASAMMSHSCAPNAAWHLDENNSYILHARSPIEQEQEITISYLSPDELMLPSSLRRQLLESTKGFRCSCSRCLEPLDVARAFLCTCGAEALAHAEPGLQATSPVPWDTGFANCGVLTRGELPDGQWEELVCNSCGPRSDLARGLALEARLLPWARSFPDFSTLAKVRETAVSADLEVPSKLLFQAESLLGDRHWILDALRHAVATAEPQRAVELLSQRLEVHQEDYCMTLRARLHVSLGKALFSEGRFPAAEASYREAAELLALLFGDDHPEHLEAASLKQAAEQKQADVRKPDAKMPTPNRTAKKRR